MNKTLNKGALILPAIILIAGCSSEEGQKRYITRDAIHCNDSTVDKRSKFILECIKNANPKSDEEPEDWIWKCQNMAEATICQTKSVIIMQECAHSAFGSCDRWNELSRQVTPN